MTKKTPPVKSLKCTDENGVKGESYSLDKKYWKEHVRTQREHAGEPYTVPECGAITIRFPPDAVGKHVKVYIEV